MAKSCCRMELVWQQDGRIGRFVERCVCHAAQNGATSERAQFYHAVALRKMIGGPRFVAAYKDVINLINDPWQWPPSLSWLRLTPLEPHKWKRLVVGRHARRSSFRTASRPAGSGSSTARIHF